jgi:hypothetical protein
MDLRRDANAVRFCDRIEPRSDVDPIAVDAGVVEYNIPLVDTEVFEVVPLLAPRQGQRSKTDGIGTRPRN